MTAAWALYTTGAIAISVAAFLSDGLVLALVVAGMACLMAGVGVGLFHG